MGHLQSLAVVLWLTLSPFAPTYSSTLTPPVVAVTSAQSTPPLDQKRNDGPLGLNQKIDALTAKVDALPNSSSDKSLIAMVGFFSTLLGALVSALTSYVLQKQKMRQEERTTRHQAELDLRASRREKGYEALARIYEFRSRQINEFYGPLRVLLRQIKLLRVQLDSRLIADGHLEGVRFQPAESRLGPFLEIIREGQEPKPFRLIDEMPFLMANYAHLMPNIGEIVAIGDQISKHLHAHSGLLNPQSSWLTDRIAFYLAHQRVLKTIYDQLLSGLDGDVVKGYSAVFPRGIDLLVERDYRNLRHNLLGWHKQARKWALQN